MVLYYLYYLCFSEHSGKAVSHRSHSTPLETFSFSERFPERRGLNRAVYCKTNNSEPPRPSTSFEAFSFSERFHKQRIYNKLILTSQKGRHKN